METILEILKFTVPSVIVGIIVYFIIKQNNVSVSNFLKQEIIKKQLELNSNNISQIIPIKINAFERVTLFLERITPNNLILRIEHTSMNVSQFQEALLKTIRKEFEHNLSQQIYISNAGWKLVNKAKEEVIQVVNSSASELQSNDSAIELSKLIINNSIARNYYPTQKAIEKIKSEVIDLFDVKPLMR